MPTLLEDVTVDLERFDLDNRVELIRSTQTSRGKGLHLSGVLKHVLISYRLPGWQKYIEELDESKIPLLWALGIMWEEFVCSLYTGWLWQPGEVRSAGVYMNCDGINPEVGCLEEAKYTSAAVRTGAEFMLDWPKMHQGKGYCLGYDYRRVRWHVLYNRKPWAPVYKRFLIEFSDKEIGDMRRMIESNLAGAIAAGYEE